MPDLLLSVGKLTRHRRPVGLPLPGNLPRQKKAEAARANTLHDMISGISNTVQQSTINRTRVRAQAPSRIPSRISSGIFCGALVSSLYHNIPKPPQAGDCETVTHELSELFRRNCPFGRPPHPIFPSLFDVAQDVHHPPVRVNTRPDGSADPFIEHPPT